MSQVTTLRNPNDPNCMSNYDYDKSKPEGPGNRTYGGLTIKSPSSPVMGKLLATWGELDQLIARLQFDIKHGYKAGNVAKTIEFPLAHARWWVAKIKNVTHNECERNELSFFEEAVSVHASLLASAAAAERMARYGAGFSN
ncbi:MAG: hypothetical protein Unbinned2819contig1000_33 [Prokaryotic dsDNA virus sp.]|nr:MAG: hypothetical protein Unbinned2819contig1000_33 [Prokaryotic dsDNA virus sp.]